MDNTKKAKRLGLLGIAICGICCALPIIGAVVGITSLTAIAFYLEKIGIFLLGLAGLYLLYIWFSKRKKAKIESNSCSGSTCECKTECIPSN